MKKVLLSAVTLLAAAVFAFENSNILVKAANNKVTICHATGSDFHSFQMNQPDAEGDLNGHLGHQNNEDIVPPFTLLVCPSDNDAYGDEAPGKDCMRGNKFAFPDSTSQFPGLNWTTQNQAIWNNNCNAVSSSPTPTPTPSADPSATPTPTPTPSPEPTSSPTIITTSEESSRRSKLSASTVSCENMSFSAEVELKDNDVAQKNIKVKFVYDNQTKEATTNNDGKASVSFGFSKNDSVYVYPEEGYDSQSSHIQEPENCQSGEVLGTSTEQTGQVLGAYAATGTANSIIADLLGLVGIVMTAGGFSLHASKRTSK